MEKHAAALPPGRAIRVGIAGFGMSGQIFHAPFLDADPRFRIAKVYERRTDRAESRYPYIETVRSFEELLTEDVDLIVLCTPNAEHASMAEQAILAGKHVITEKPAAASSARVRELSALAREKGVLYTVFQNRRLDGDFLTVRELIRGPSANAVRTAEAGPRCTAAPGGLAPEEGLLGYIVDYEAHFDRFVRGTDPKPWRQDGGEGVGILWDLGVHLVDQAYALFGMPDEVFAEFRKQRAETPGPDRVTVELFYHASAPSSLPCAARGTGRPFGAPGLRAVLSMGEVTALPGPRFAVHGTKGSFLKHGTDPQEAALAAGGRPPGRGAADTAWGSDDPASYGTLARIREDGTVEQSVVPTVPGDYGLYYDNIFEVLTSGTEPLVSPEEAADVLRILEAALESGASGARVRI